MDYTVYRILQARILELSSLSFLQGIFPKQGSNPGLPHCRWIPAEPQGKPLVSKKSCTGLGSGRPAGQSLQQCLDGTEPGHPLLQPTTPPFNLFSSHKLENHLLCSSLSLGPVNTFFFFFFLALLVLCCCRQAFSSCEQGQLFHCSGFSCCGAQALGCVGVSSSSSGALGTGSLAVAHGLSCSKACAIFPDPGSNPCLLHWQADSWPLSHQGKPPTPLFELSSYCQPWVPRFTGIIPWRWRLESTAWSYICKPALPAPVWASISTVTIRPRGIGAPSPRSWPRNARVPSVLEKQDQLLKGAKPRFRKT